MVPSNKTKTGEEKEALIALKSLLGVATDWRAIQELGEEGVDFILESDARQLAVGMKASSDATSIQRALAQLEQYRRLRADVIPLIATKFMGAVGKQICREARVGWYDLSGNADIDIPGLRVLIDGKENQFKRPGRPSSVFAPKASRMTRWLLMYDDTGWTQQELTRQTDLDKGYVSRVLKRMKSQGLIFLRGEKYFVNKREALLNAWRSQYDFSKHRILKGTMPVRSGEEGIMKIASVLPMDSYAATGLAGAWFVDGFATFRTATVFLREEPSSELLPALSFSPGEKGANTWLVLPNDEGVFVGREEKAGIMCAHPVQIYLDLQAHPERASEAAEHLRQNYLNWGTHDE